MPLGANATVGSQEITPGVFECGRTLGDEKPFPGARDANATPPQPSQTMYWRPDVGSVASPGSTLLPLHEPYGWTGAGLVGCTTVAPVAASMPTPLATIAIAAMSLHERFGLACTRGTYSWRAPWRPSPERREIARSKEI